MFTETGETFAKAMNPVHDCGIKRTGAVQISPSLAFLGQVGDARGCADGDPYFIRELDRIQAAVHRLLGVLEDDGPGAPPN
jgi:hypothetical protein